MDNRINIKAVINFAFMPDLDLSPAEMIEEIIDRIKNGEYFPDDLIDLKLIPTV